MFSSHKNMTAMLDGRTQTSSANAKIEILEPVQYRWKTDHYKQVKAEHIEIIEIKFCSYEIKFHLHGFTKYWKFANHLTVSSIGTVSSLRQVIMMSEFRSSTMLPAPGEPPSTKLNYLSKIYNRKK